MRKASPEFAATVADAWGIIVFLVFRGPLSSAEPGNQLRDLRRIPFAEIVGGPAAFPGILVSRLTLLWLCPRRCSASRVAWVIYRFSLGVKALRNPTFVFLLGVRGRATAGGVCRGWSLGMVGVSGIPAL